MAINALFQVMEQFDLDYTQDLIDLKRDVQFALSVFQRTQPLEKI